jgi:NAD(P)H-nitrite reductase large subunit
VVDDAENRKALYERLLARCRTTKDPWLEAVEKPEVRREYRGHPKSRKWPEVQS